MNVLLEKATRKLGELNAFALIVPNIELFIQMHIVKEAHNSSKIEGTQTNIDEALLPEEDIALEKQDDWQEVQNYMIAMRYAIIQMEKLPISNRLLIVGLLLILFVNTWRFSSKQVRIEKTEFGDMDTRGAVKRLSESIKIKTISIQDDSKIASKSFFDFHIFLETSFPQLHKTLEKEVINKYSLLYRWPGKNPEHAPMALLAHLDVVPVDPETEKDWAFSPFGGEVAEGFVWGRGTLDMKGVLMAVMESVETLINKGFSPERTLYLAFGHDEEIGGLQGAQQISAHLEKQGVRFSYTLDEGMVILDEALSPTGKHMGVIGITEKGYVTLKLEVTGEGGHSSSPPARTNIGRLCRAVTLLEKKQMPATLDGPAGLFFKHISPALPFGKKLLFTNQWLFKPLILLLLGKTNATNALIRNTTAPTMIQGGVKENVLPGSAHSLVNFRILPGSSVQMIIDHVKKVINDNRVSVDISGSIVSEPSITSSPDSPGFLNIEKTIRQVFPETSVAPGLVTGMTDSRHYTSISDNCYRFAPILFGPDGMARIHGTNERISIDNYGLAIQFYMQLIKNSA